VHCHEIKFHLISDFLSIFFGAGGRSFGTGRRVMVAGVAAITAVVKSTEFGINQECLAGTALDT
jgi:hypothetical protein